MTHATQSDLDANHGGVPGAAHGESVFVARFSEEERRELLEEDRTAQLAISAILTALIGIGVFLGVLGVLLVVYLNLNI